MTTDPVQQAAEVIQAARWNEREPVFSVEIAQALADAGLLLTEVEWATETAFSRTAYLTEHALIAAQAWDEGFEAGATWIPSTPSGISCDPPLNPYREDQS